MRVVSFIVALCVVASSLSVSARRRPRHTNPSETTAEKTAQYGNVRTYTFTAGKGVTRAHRELMTSVNITCEIGHRPLWLTTTHKRQSVEHFYCVPLDALVDTKAGEPCTAKDVECEAVLMIRSRRGDLLSPPSYEVGTFAHPLAAHSRCLALEELDPKFRVEFPNDPERTKRLAPLPSGPGAINCQQRLVNGLYERTILFEGALESVSDQ